MLGELTVLIEHVRVRSSGRRLSIKLFSSEPEAILADDAVFKGRSFVDATSADAARLGSREVLVDVQNPGLKTGCGLTILAPTFGSECSTGISLPSDELVLVSALDAFVAHL
eukprot:973220-Amorphochlora_amoeboformis.AAC.1